ncbi:MAG TPA: response regulator [Aliidongia sp.]|nr:response regulator [Aliidongia sp.]
MAHMLVIDDDPSVRSLVSGLLQACGHSVVEAENGRVGLQAFDKDRIDLVVTDIVMPEQEGIATISAIRRLSANIPILAMSGSCTVGRYGDYLHAATVMGASATLPKPVRADHLLEAIDRLLGARIS